MPLVQDLFVAVLLLAWFPATHWQGLRLAAPGHGETKGCRLSFPCDSADSCVPPAKAVLHKAPASSRASHGGAQGTGGSTGTGLLWLMSPSLTGLAEAA